MRRSSLSVGFNGAATELWTDVAGDLQRTGAEQGGERIVTLSIVGTEKTSFGYYLAKLEHERAAADGPGCQPQLTLTFPLWCRRPAAARTVQPGCRR